MPRIKLLDGTIIEAEPGKRIIDYVGEDRRALVARVDGEKLVDLTSPVREDYGLIEILGFDDEDGKKTYWHTSAHILAQAVKRLFPEAKLGIGPAIETGFYYDFYIGDKTFTAGDLERIEEEMRRIIKEDLPLIREEMSREEAIELFKRLGEKFKVELLMEMREEVVSVYRQGEFIDLCRGPHLPSTGYVKAVKILNTSSAYWRGDERREVMQRIYGVSFPSKKMLREYLAWLEEVKKRDHRVLGQRLELFLMPADIIGPGLVIWRPRGALMRTIIEDMLRRIHLKRGYQLVVTPHIAYSRLWEISGHLRYYHENMYVFEKEGVQHVVKPMNCPFHILVYKSKVRSYRDLPIRLFELGTVYRYERSGTLHGLLRVRGFTQDDAHIFATPEQLEDEVVGIIDLLEEILRVFGFEEYIMELSTWDPRHPEDYMGTEEDWRRAEDALRKALERKGYSYRVMPGEAAFYGPKIDVKLVDSMGRKWQCATIQVDFNLPRRFNITYVGPDGKEHLVVMIHRALLGSIERFMGILIEHYAGNFPVWLAPEQVRVLPVSAENTGYAEKVYGLLRENGIRAGLDAGEETLSYRIRQAELMKIPYVVVVGRREEENNTVSVRRKGVRGTKTMSLEEFIEQVKKEAQPPL